MKKKKIKEKSMDIDRVCWKICSAFDYDQDVNPFDWGIEQGSSPGLGEFLYSLILENKLGELKKDRGQENLTEREEDIVREVLSLVYQIPFAFGYVIGQMVDIPFPEIQKQIEKIKKVLRDKALLPYLPREKKAA